MKRIKFFFILIGLFICINNVNAQKTGTPFISLSEEYGKVNYFEIAGCPSFPSVLYRWSEYKIEIDFYSFTPVETLTMNIYLEIQGVLVSYAYSDYISLSPGYPLSPYQNCVLRFDLKILSTLPSMLTNLIFKVQDNQNHSIIYLKTLVDIV